MISLKTVSTVVGAETIQELLLLIDQARAKGFDIIGDPHYNFRAQLWCQTVSFEVLAEGRTHR